MNTQERLTALGEHGMRLALSYLSGRFPEVFEECVSDAEGILRRAEEIHRELSERSNPVVREITPDGRFRFQRLG